MFGVSDLCVAGYQHVQHFQTEDDHLRVGHLKCGTESAEQPRLCQTNTVFWSMMGDITQNSQCLAHTKITVWELKSRCVCCQNVQVVTVKYKRITGELSQKGHTFKKKNYVVIKTAANGKWQGSIRKLLNIRIYNLLSTT